MKSILSILERQTLNTKLSLAIGMGFLISLLIGLGGLSSIHSLSRTAQLNYDQDFVGVTHIQAAQNNLTLMGRDLRWMAMSSSFDDRAAAKKRVIDAESSLRKHIEEGRKRIVYPEGIKALKTFDEVLPAFSMNVEFAIALLARNDAFSDGEATQFLAGQEYGNAIIAADQALAAITESTIAGAHQSALYSATVAARTWQYGIASLAFFLLANLGVGVLVVRSIRRPLNDLKGIVESLAEGQLDIVVPYTDQINEVGDMANAIRILQLGAQRTAAQLEAKSFLADLSYKLQHVESREDFGQQALSVLSNRIGFRQGLLLANSGEKLDVIARYGAPPDATTNQSYSLEDGLIGQCARDRRPIILKSPADSKWQIYSGLGYSAPAQAWLLPLTYGGDLAGILELGFPESVSTEIEMLLELVVEVIAMPLHNWCMLESASVTPEGTL